MPIAFKASTWIGKATPSVLLGAVSLLPSEPSATMPGQRGRHRRGMKPGLVADRVPWPELGEPASVPGANEHDVPQLHLDALLALCEFHVLRENMLARLEPRDSA